MVLTVVFTLGVVVWAEVRDQYALALLADPSLLPVLAPSTSKFRHTSNHTQVVFVANSIADTTTTTTATTAGNIKGLGCNNRDQEEVAGAANHPHFKRLEAITDPFHCQLLTVIATIEDLRLFVLAITTNIVVTCSQEASSFVGNVDNTCYSVVEVDTQDDSMESDLANTIAANAIIAIVTRFKYCCQCSADLNQL